MSIQLKYPALLKQAAWLDGQWVGADSGARFAVTNPASGATVAEVPLMGRFETERAIAAAAVAQKQWRTLTAKERSARLKQWFVLIQQHQEDLAHILTAEQGKPLAEARGEIAYGASFIEWFAEEAQRVYGEIIPAPLNDRRLLVLKQPIGVTAAITSWNFPTAMITRKAAPALAAGCAMIVKPAEQTPLSALALAVLAEEAGIPGGVFQVITGDPREIGAAICDSPVVTKLSFTGSTEVGRILMRQSADTIKKLSLELGGNAPFIVFDDADLDAAVEGAIASKYRNAGQTCVCANRLFVQDGVFDVFAQKLALRVGQLQVGDGFTDGVTQGPLIDDAALAKVESHVADAIAKARGWWQAASAMRSAALSTSRPCWPTSARIRWCSARKPSVRWRRCSASTPTTKSSNWPTAPNSAWRRISTAATSGASGASPKRSNTAWSASTAESSRMKSRRSAASNNRVWGAKDRTTASTNIWKSNTSQWRGYKHGQRDRQGS